MQYIIIKVNFTLALGNFRHRVWVSCLDHLNYLLPRNVRVWVIDFASRHNDFSMKFWNCPNDVVYLFFQLISFPVLMTMAVSDEGSMAVSDEGSMGVSDEGYTRNASKLDIYVLI